VFHLMPESMSCRLSSSHGRPGTEETLTPESVLLLSREGLFLSSTLQGQGMYSTIDEHRNPSFSSWINWTGH